MSNSDFTATYSPEDNKLRLYAADRLDDETYAQARELGFRWAPKQELFVSPRWTPQREDFCVELAGEITAETSTMIDRAEVKIERIEVMADNAQSRANGFHNAAQAISERFAYGQPILVGHHSERKARRDAEKMDSNARRASEEQAKIKYYDWKAQGVAEHANRKSCSRTRLNRIKTLLADLRTMQRRISTAEKGLNIWQKIDAMEAGEKKTKYLSSFAGHYEYGVEVKMWYSFDRGEVDAQEIIDGRIKCFGSTENLAHRQRWVMHILNRLGYEQSEMVEVSLYQGELTAPIIQTFCRTHGAEKPKATKTGEAWRVVSVVNLPAHLSNTNILELEPSGWVELMQSVGYAVPDKRTTRPQLPILNFEFDTIELKRGWKPEKVEQIRMTKDEYAVTYGKEVVKSPCGRFRLRICFQSDPNGRFTGDYKAVFLTDSKTHESPADA